MTMWPAKEIERFWSRVDRRERESCWPWKGAAKPDGYMQVRMGQRNHYPHRVSVWLSGREIPDGQVVDHICRNRACCNPAHLRVIPRALNAVENSIGPSAVNAAKTHCVRGHALVGENLGTQNRKGRIKRRCLQCAADREKARRKSA